MKSNLRNVVAVLPAGLALIIAACGPEQDIGGAAMMTETRTEGVRFGIPTSARPEVGRISFPGRRRCSATLISPQHVLTAAHCQGYKPMERGGEFVIEQANGGIARYGIEQSLSLGHAVGDLDLAVASLRSPVPPEIATPASIATGPTRKGDVLTIVAYGEDDQGGPSGIKRTMTWTKTDTDRNGAPGDSGGPIFAGRLEDNGPIVFVMSGAYLWPFYRDRDVYGDPVRHAKRLSAHIDALASEGVCFSVMNHDKWWSEPVCEAEISGWHSFYAFRAFGGGRSHASICYAGTFSNNLWTKDECDGTAIHYSFGLQQWRYPMGNLRVKVGLPSGGSVIYGATGASGRRYPEVRDGAHMFPGGAPERLTGLSVRLDRNP